MKQVRLLAILLLFPIMGWAQSSSKTYIPRELYVGPTIGTMVSTVSFFDKRAKNDYYALPSPGFDAGIMVSRRIKEHFLLNAQLIYSQKSKLVKGGSDSLPGKQRPDPSFRNLQVNRFIELPIYYMLEFKNNVGTSAAGDQKSYKWFIGAGPTISYWLGGKGSLQSGNLKEDLIESLKYNIVFNKDNAKLDPQDDAHKLNVTAPNRVQFAINFTGGIALEPFGLEKIVISTRLEIGQSFMAKGAPGYFPGSKNDSDVLRSKYHSLRFTVSYLIDTKIEDSKRGKSTNKKSNATKIRRKRR